MCQVGNKAQWDVSFIWISNKIIHISYIEKFAGWLYTSAVTNNKDVGAKCRHRKVTNE